MTVIVLAAALAIAGWLVPCAAQAQTYSWNTTSGTWDTTTSNWAGAGSTWTNGSSNTAVFAYSTASGTVTVNGAITTGTILVANATTSGNYTFTNGTSGSISALAFFANSGISGATTSRLQNLTLTTSGNFGVGGNTKLTIGGSSTISVGGTIGGLIGPISWADWGVLTIQDSAVVTATGGVNGNTEAWGLNLNGGTLYTPRIQASDREDGGTGRLTFNGTRVVATTSTNAFVTVGANYLATNSALVNSGGAIFDTNGYDVGVAINLKNGTSSGSLTKFGAGTLTLSGTTSNYSGGTTINAGTLVMGSGSALGAAGGNLAVNGGTLDLRGQSLTVGGLTGSSGGLITSNTTGSIILTASSASSGTFAGSLANGSGTLGLTKSGAGTLSLTGSNSYTGGTLVSAGVLAVATKDALPGWDVADKVTVNSGGGIAVGAAFSDADVATMIATGSNFRAGAAIGFDTTAGDRTYTANFTDAPQGALGLAKAGANTLTLSGSSSYTGPTIISAGTVAFTYAGDQTLSGTISGPGSLAKSGAGTLTLTASNSYSGGTVVNGGLIAVATKDALPGWNVANGLAVNSGAGILVGNGFADADVATMIATGSNFRAGASIGFDTTAADRAYATNLGNSPQGALGLTKSGANTLTISGSSSYTGPTLINAGTVSFTFAGNQSLSGGISGAGGLAKSGTGTLSLTGSNSYSGGTVVNAGILAVANTDGLPGWNVADKLTVNSGGQVAVGNAFSDADVTTMLSTGSNFRAGASIGFDTTAGNRTYAANLGDTAQGSLGLVKAGANTLVVSGSNSYTGGTTITAGTVQVANTSALGAATGYVTVNAGALDLNGYSVTAGLLSGGTASTISTSSAASSTLTVGSSGSSAYAGVIANGSGTVGILKQNAGVLTLSNTASTFTGVTTINGGTLDVARLANGGANSSIGAASTAAANLVINGGVLRYTGNTAQSTDRLVTVGLNGATFDSSGSATVVFSSTGSVAYAGSGDRMITFTGSYRAGNNQFGPVIADSGGKTSVMKTGTGTWLLGVSGRPNNTYTGSTTILAGTLIGGATDGQQGFGNTSAIYLGDTSGSNNATVQFGTGVATAFNSVPIIVQSGNTGTATIVSLTNNSINGTITLGSANSSGKSVVIRNSGDFRWGNGINSVIQDPSGLVAGTAGTVIFDNAATAGTSANWKINAANTYTGDTRLLSGSLTVSNTNAFQNSTLDLGFAGDTGAVVWNQNSTLGGLKGTRALDTSGKVLSIGNNNQSTSYSGALSGSGGLTKIGTGMLTLSGSNTFTGATTVSAGTLSVGHAAALGASSGNLIASGGVLDLGGYGISRSGTVSFTGGTVQSGTLTNDTVAFDGQAGTVSATLAGAAGLTKSGAGTLSLTGSNSYTGGTLVSAGVLAVATKDALPGWNVADKVTVNSGGGIAVGAAFSDADVATMIATGSNFRAGAAIGFDTTAADRTYTSNLANSPQGALGLAKSGGNTLTLSGSSSYTGPTIINGGTVAFTYAGDQTLSGTISGAGSLAKSGAGTLTLTASNSYSGGTVVNGGVIAVATKDALPGWNVVNRLTVNSGAGVMVGNGFADADVATMIATGSNFRAGASIGFDTTAADRTYATNLGNSSQGALGLTKSGANTLTISGSSSYTGPTLINAGTISFTSTGNQSLSGGISGAGGLAKSGTGTLSLTGSNSYSGGTVVNAGVLAVASKDALPGWDVADKVTVISGGGITVGNAFADANVATMIATGSNFRAGAAIGFDTTAGDRTYASNLVNSPQGALGLIKSGANTVTLSGSNSYTGPTRINAGTVAFSYAGNQTLSSTISGPGNLAKSGTGTLTLSAAPTLTGTVTISAGRLALPSMNGIPFTTIIDSGTLDTSSAAGAWGGNTITFGANGGTVFWGGSNWYGGGTMNVISTAGAPTSQMIGSTYLNLNGGTVNFTANGDINLNAPLANAGSIIKGGTGTLILATNAFGSAQSYNVFVDAGTLRASANDALAGTGAITFRGGTLQYNAASPSDWSSRIRNSGSAIAVDTNGRSITWSGTINNTNTGGLSKIGSGTLALTGTNTFTGVTTIAAGLLSINGTSALQGTSGLTIAGGAGLTYTGGADIFGKNVTVTAGSGTGTIRNSGGATLTLSGTLSKDNSVLRLTGGAFNVTGLITGATPGASDLFVDAASVTLSNTNTYNGPTYVFNSGTLSLGVNNAIPNTSAVTLGDAASVGTLVLGTYTDSISQLVFSGSGGTLSLSGDKTASAQLATAGSLTLGSSANLVLTSAGTSAGLYRLISATSISGTFASGNVTGIPTNYSLIYSGTEVDLQRKGDQAATFTMTTGTVTRALVYSTVALSGTIANASPAGSANLAVSLSSGGALNVTGFSGTSSVAPQASTSVAGTIQAGSSVGSQTWSVVNTDNNAITTTSLASGSLTVVADRTFTTPSIAFGRFLNTSSPLSGTSTITSTGLSGTTANATIGGFGSSNGLTLSLVGGTNAFTGLVTSQTATYTTGGSYSGGLGGFSGSFNAAATNEFGGTSVVAVAYTGTAVAQRSFSVSNSGTISLGNFLRTASVSGSTSVTSLGSYATTASGTLGTFNGSNTNGFTLTTNDSTAFNGADSQTANYSLSGSASSAGAITGSFTSNVQAELGSINSVSVALVGTAYDAASITKVQDAAVGNGGTISIRNAAGDYRSAAYVASSSVTGQGWSVTGFDVGSSAAADATLAGTAHFDGTGLLSGTYAGTFSATFENNQSLTGAAAGDLGSQSWSLYHTYMNTSGTGSTSLAADTALSAVSLSSGTGAGATLASFAAGVTGSLGANVTMSFTSGTAGQYSDILHLQGTDGIAQVLQLTYDPAKLGTTNAETLLLGWLDTRTGSLTNGEWINSVLGNTGTNGVTMDSPFLGSWATYSSLTGKNAATALGAFGVDTSTKTVWAAVNHNSQFVIVVPEPGTLALAGLGIAAAAWCGLTRNGRRRS